jgi:hypothetical protein
MINLGFLTEGKLAAIFIKTFSWGLPTGQSFYFINSAHQVFWHYHHRAISSLLVLFLNLIWEGTCIGFFVDLILQCQMPRTTPCLLSHRSHPISRHLIFAHEFKIFVKTTSVFEKFQVIQFWLPRPEYPPPWEEYPGGPDYPPPGPDNPAGVSARYIKGAGWAALWAVPTLTPLVSPATAASPPPPPELRPSPWPDFAGGCSPPSWEGFHQADFAMDAGIFLSLGCDFTLAYSWCLALYLLFFSVINHGV